ncbi:MAG: hypothetical protein JSW07_22515 [bacterium]|nr:MAG: hypothetical protein JSW07_22515 [bacterium]
MRKPTFFKSSLILITMLVMVMIINLGFSLIFIGFSYAQEIDPVKEEMFKQAREALDRARESDVPLFSPNNFNKANEFYRTALEDYEKGEKLSQIRESLNRSLEHIEAAFETSRLSRVILEKVTITRQEAKDVEVHQYAPDLFSRADSKFFEAAARIEEGDLKNAKSLIKEAEIEFRKAAIEAINRVVMNEGNEKLQALKNTIPPESYQASSAKLMEIEKFIETQVESEFAIGELFHEVHNQINQALNITGLEISTREMPDLVIEGVALNPEVPSQDERVVISAVISNLGNIPAERIIVLFLSDEEQEIGKAIIPYIEPGQQGMAEFSTTAPEPAEWQITVRVDPENLIRETNEQNNEIRQSYIILPKVIDRLESARIPTQPQLFQEERMIYESFDGEFLRGWELVEGASLIPEGNNQLLRLPGNAEAVWTDVISENYTLMLRYLPEMMGNSRIILQRSGYRYQRQEYQLRFENEHAVLARITNREERELIAADLHLEPNEWYDVIVHSLKGWMRVEIDRKEIFTFEDPEPLPAGMFAFRYEGDRAVIFDDVRFIPWTTELADAQKNRIKMFELEPKLLPPKYSGPHIPSEIIPLEVAVYKAKKDTIIINPGPVPPNFVHTWIIDLRDIDVFNLYFGSPPDILLDKNDYIKIFTAKELLQPTPQPMKTIKVTSSAKELVIDISKVNPDQTKNGKKYKRIYLQLETSAISMSRRFVLKGLEKTMQKTGQEEALVVADDINYNTNAYITETYNRWGKKLKLHAFWNPLYGFSYPQPAKKDGWYQIGKCLADYGQGFFTLAYYNEQRGLLRLYLYNYELTDATVYSVKLSLLGRNAKQYTGYDKTIKWLEEYDELKGAFFPTDPNPNKWGSITLPIKYWSKNQWALIEVPLLYPMAEKLPAAKLAALPGVPATWYRSIYEDELQKGKRNMMLQVEVGSYLKGELEGDFVGKGVGKAIQTINGSGGPSASEVAKGIWEGIKQGKDWFDKAEKFHGEAQTYYNSIKGTAAANDPSMKIFGGLVQLGASAWGGAAGMAGAAVSILSSFLLGSSPEPLHLSIDMALQGKFKAGLSISLQPRKSRFFLPGRFSINEADLPITDARTTESFLPYYDRTMGLFGYRYNPSDVKFRAIRWDNPNQMSGYGFDISPRFVFPAVPNPDPNWLKQLQDYNKYWKKCSLQQVDRFLPVIYNPYAEITPINPIVVSTKSNYDNLGKKYPYSCAPWRWYDHYKWFYDISYTSHIKPEPGDPFFKNQMTLHTDQGPNMSIRVFVTSAGFSCGLYGYSEVMPGGMLLQVLPKKHYVPGTYKDFKNKELKNLAVHNWYDCSLSNYKKFDQKDPLPIHDVIYYWDLPYIYYARSRKKADGSVPINMETAHLSSPVTLDVMRYLFKWYPDADVWDGKRHDAKSNLLVY